MKILIDIGHPGHVHLFKNFAWDMQKKEHEIFFTCREKEFENYLLEKYEFQYQSFGKKKSSKVGKLCGLIEFDVKEFLAGLKFKPDLFLSHGSMYAAHASWLLRKPHISMEDTGNKEQVSFYKPFTKYILTPSVFPDLYGKKQIKYNGYHELAYLHPDYYEPDDGIFKFMNNYNKQKYIILRFVSWDATHDIGKGGLDIKISEKLISFFEEHGYRIYISSEKQLPKHFEKYKIKIPPHLFHHALFYSDMVIGDSQTIIAEAGILGIPAIRFNDLIGISHGYHHKELEEKYNLIYNIHTKEVDKLFKTIESLFKIKNLKNIWNDKRNHLFKEKVNVTEFLIDFINNLNYMK